MKIFLLFCLLLIHFINYGQSVKHINFLNTEWNVNNNNGEFYKADTVYFYRIIDILNDNQKLNLIYREIEYNKGKDFTKMLFKGKSNMEVSDHSIESWVVTKRLGNWKWKFNEKRQTLDLIFNKKLKYSFIIVNNYKDQILSNYQNANTGSNDERWNLMVLTLVRNKGY